MALLLAGGAARAAEPDGAVQLAGLFMQSCLTFAGDAAGLRQWARGMGLPEVSEPARRAFLNGADGTVFDASNRYGKFVIISADRGSCSAVTNDADGQSVVAALEADFSTAGIQLRLTGERDDAQESGLLYRDYAADRDRRRWRIVAATVKAQKAGQAMLTADAE